MFVELTHSFSLSKPDQHILRAESLHFNASTGREGGGFVAVMELYTRNSVNILAV